MNAGFSGRLPTDRILLPLGVQALGGGHVVCRPPYRRLLGAVLAERQVGRGSKSQKGEDSDSGRSISWPVPCSDGLLQAEVFLASHFLLSDPT